MLSRQWMCVRQVAPTVDPATNPFPMNISQIFERSNLTALCVYATLPSGFLESLSESGGGEFTESRRWVGALEILNRNRKRGLRLPILFARRERADGVRYLGIVDQITIPTPEMASHGTSLVRVSMIQRLLPKRPKGALRLKSTGLPLDPEFDRSYAICHTPDFLIGPGFLT